MISPTENREGGGTVNFGQMPSGFKDTLSEKEKFRQELNENIVNL